MPMYRCMHCNNTCTPPACVVACVESSGLLWMDSTTLILYNSLRHRAGLSVDAFTKSINDMFSLYPWMYPGDMTEHVLDARQVRDSYRMSRCLYNPMDDLEQIGEAHCISCAS